MAPDLVIGIDLGGTHMQVGIVRSDGTVLHRDGASTRAELGHQAVIDRISEAIENVLTHAEINLDRIAGIGIGAPGAIDPETNIVLEAPNLGWKRVDLKTILSKRFNAIPVRIDNDVNVAVLGENAFGSGHNARNVIGVWVGTGVGGGLILDGKLFRGGLGTAGEIGQTTLLPDLPSGQDKMEHQCSRKFLTQQIQHALTDGGRTSAISQLVDDDLDAISSAHIARAYEQDDPVVTEIVNRGADLLGMSIANAVTLLSLPLVLLGGGLTEAMGDHYIQRIAASMRRHIFPRMLADKIEVRATTLRDNAGLLGAAMLAIEEAGLDQSHP